MRKWQRIVAMLALLIGIALPVNVSAVQVFDQCSGNSDSSVCASQNDSASSMIGIVINTALIVLGMIAVLMIVIGGIRYATSNGESNKIKEAKDTILYAIVGLVVAILSYSIINFVLGRF